MTFVIGYEENFLGKSRVIYYVNRRKEDSIGSSIITTEECPHCSVRHTYNLFESKGYYDEGGWRISVYDCKCGSCDKDFELEVEFEL